MAEWKEDVKRCDPGTEARGFQRDGERRFIDLIDVVDDFMDNPLVPDVGTDTPSSHLVDVEEPLIGNRLMLQHALRTLVVLLSVSSIAQAGEVTTIAGTGENRSFGDGGEANAAGVGGPFGLVIGPDKALYVCEISGHVVRRIDLDAGTISTVVGTGEKGNAGDGGAATAALVNEPYEVRFDSKGNLWFVDMMSACVRRVDAQTGEIMTIAGTGENGFSGDGGPANQAMLNRPHSIALDADDNVYICDIGNHRVRRVDAQSGVISTFAGTGERRPTPDGAPIAGTPLNGPRTLVFDGDHSLFLALREGNAVYRLDLRTKTVHHLAGTGVSGYAGDGGPAKQALLSGPKGIALGPQGDVYLADTESHTIRVVRRKTGIIETLVGDGRIGDGPDGEPTRCRLSRPHGVFVDADGTVYIGDSGNHKVRRYVP